MCVCAHVCVCLCGRHVLPVGSVSYSTSLLAFILRDKPIKAVNDLCRGIQTAHCPSPLHFTSKPHGIIFFFTFLSNSGVHFVTPLLSQHRCLEQWWRCDLWAWNINSMCGDTKLCLRMSPPKLEVFILHNIKKPHGILIYKSSMCVCYILHVI